MKLSECTLGKLVRDGNDIGHIVGLTYNVSVRNTGNMTGKELLDRTIPLIRFPDGTERGVHPANLEIFD